MKKMLEVHAFSIFKSINEYPKFLKSVCIHIRKVDKYLIPRKTNTDADKNASENYSFDFRRYYN